MPVKLRLSRNRAEVFLRQGPDRYIRHVIERATAPEKNCDVFRTSGVYECVEGDKGFVDVRPLLNGGELETAVRVAAPRDTNHMGGALHGNEEMEDIVFLADRLRVAAPLVTDCDRVEIVQRSTLFLIGTRKATWYQPKGEPFLSLRKRWVFDGDGLTLTTWADVGEGCADLVVEHAFFAMLPMLREFGGEQITHSCKRAPEWLVEDCGAAGFTPRQDTSDHIRIFGDHVFAECRITKGWNAPDREAYVSSRPQGNKVYFNFANGMRASDLFPLEAEARIRWGVLR